MLMRRLRAAWRAALRILGLAWVRYQVQVAGFTENPRRACYVLEKNQVLDRLILEDLCMTRGWARPFATIPNTLGLEHEAFIGLRELRGYFVRHMVPAGDDSLRQLSEWLSERPQADIQLLPVSVYWGRTPARERSLFKLLLAEEWGTAGRMRRFLRVLFHGRNVLVKVSEPVSLSKLVAEGLSTERTARKTARLLRIHFRRQRAATIGPDLSHRRMVVADILRSRTVSQAIARDVASGKRSQRRARSTARRYAFEIAADYSYPLVRVLERLLSKLWNRLYDGIDVHHIETMDHLAAGSEVIYVPCHRSHIDYLLLSYVIYQRGLALPHIAAGVNLNMPVVGSILRRGGAFFLRRSFRGKALYTAVFRSYLAAVQAKGFPLEFFVEGTRSRTGRLLQPKAGMLAMTVDNYLADRRRPVVFVPVYFGYEKLIEGETFVGELRGRDKRQETVGGLLRSIGALRGEFGRVQVNFAAPIQLDEHLDDIAPGWRDQPSEDQFRPEWFNAAVAALGNRIMVGINASAAVNSTALVALVVLGMPKQAIVEGELLDQITLYQRLLMEKPYAERVTSPGLSAAETVAHCERMGWLQRRSHALGDVLYMEERRAVLASYYRNSVIHLFALPSLIACSVTNRAEQARGELLATIAKVYPFIRAELFLRWSSEDLDSEIPDQIVAMHNLGLLRYQEFGQLVMEPEAASSEGAQLELFAQIVLPFVERYYLATALLLSQPGGTWTREELTTSCRQAAERLSLIYELNAPDMLAGELFRTFVSTLIDTELAHLDDNGSLGYDTRLASLEDALSRMLPRRRRETLWQFAEASAASARRQAEAEPEPVAARR